MHGGILTAMITPFHSDGSLDIPAFERLAAHLLEHGSDGLVVAGTTGEASTLNDGEKLSLFEAARRVAGDHAPVMAGTGSNDTAHSVELTERAGELGVSAALIVTPYYNRPNREGIVGHVAAVAEVSVPIVLYNIPSRTTVNMEPDLLDELAGLEPVIGVKQANPDLDECRRTVDAGRLTVWAGNDDMLMPVIEMGGEGVISVTSHVAGERMAEIVLAARSGKMDEARTIDAGLADLYAGLFITTNPIPVKAACAMLNLIPSDHMRLPMVPASPVQRDIVRTTLDAQNLLATA